MDKADIIDAMYEASYKMHFMASELVKALAESILRAVEDDKADNEFYISLDEIKEWKEQLDRIGGHYETEKKFDAIADELGQDHSTVEAIAEFEQTLAEARKRVNHE